MAGISIVVLILTQMDKLVISHRFSLRAFGYYMLATSAASALYYGISPLYNAFFPRFVQLMAAGNESGLATLYHRGSQAASVAIFPAALLLAFYSRDLMWLWTQDRETAARTGLIVSILVLAYAANAIMHLPYGLQLASGWTRLSLGFNLLWVIGLLPILNIMTGRYGVPGAAVVWLALNCSYLIIVVPLMHRRLLRREMWRWYTVDIVSPLLGSLCVLVIAHAAVPTPTGRLALFAYLCGLWLAAACAAAALAPHIRSLVARLVLRRVSI
jgi:O-antigen/teichoic acid export membrane protein